MSWHRSPRWSYTSSTLQLNELRGRGVQVDLTDTAGTPLRLDEGNGLAATGGAAASNH